jgi:hypothetical protein
MASENVIVRFELNETFFVPFEGVVLVTDGFGNVVNENENGA